jgi:hypothetical protein
LPSKSLEQKRGLPDAGAMRNTLPVLCALGLLLGAGCRSTPAPPARDGSLRLFNGQNLDGWLSYLSAHGLQTQDVWSVQDGILVCKGEPMGYLYTTQTFQNFKLIVEWRWPADKKPGNSGILMRINGAPQKLPRCIECQLKSGSAGDLFGFHGMALEGPAERLHQIKGHALGGDFTALPRLATAENPPGEWNRAEITVQGGAITVFINGVKVNEAQGAEVVRGPIGFQSEGGEIHFRTIRIIPLSN